MHILLAFLFLAFNTFQVDLLGLSESEKVLCTTKAVFNIRVPKAVLLASVDTLRDSTPTVDSCQKFSFRSVFPEVLSRNLLFNCSVTRLSTINQFV